MKADSRVVTFLCGVLLVGGAGADGRLTPSVTPTPREDRPGQRWWMTRHREKLAQIDGDRPVVFVGDSITHGWEGAGKAQWDKYFANLPCRALNLGFSADRSDMVLWRIAHGELDGYKAKVVILMIGTNNTGHYPVDKAPPIEVIVGIRAVLNAIREKQPDARIILHAILPRCDSAEFDRRNQVVNRELWKLADGRHVIWCDFGDQLLAPDGKLYAAVSPDGLHPGPYGYEVWANAVLPIIDRVLAAKPGASVAGRFAARANVLPEEGDLPNRCRPTSRLDAEGWTDRLLAKRNEVASAEEPYDLVLVGDGTARSMEGKDCFGVKADRILNLGFEGDLTEHIIWRLINGELDGYQAKRFRVMVDPKSQKGDKGVVEALKRIHEFISAKHPNAIVEMDEPLFVHE